MFVNASNTKYRPARLTNTITNALSWARVI